MVKKEIFELIVCVHIPMLETSYQKNSLEIWLNILLCLC